MSKFKFGDNVEINDRHGYYTRQKAVVINPDNYLVGVWIDNPSRLGYDCGRGFYEDELELIPPAIELKPLEWGGWLDAESLVDVENGFENTRKLMLSKESSGHGWSYLITEESNGEYKLYYMIEDICDDMWTYAATYDNPEDAQQEANSESLILSRIKR